MNTRAVALTVGALVVLAGCGSGSSGGSSPGAVGTTTTPSLNSLSPTPTGSPTTGGSATPSPTVTRTVPASLAHCRSSQLSLSLGQGQGAAGTTYTPVVFTNSGSAACELTGYPGLSFVDASGRLIGKPAVRDPGPAKTIRLAANGGTANALLRQPEPGNFDPSTCQQTTAAKLRVYPPGETVGLFINDPAPVCSSGSGRPGVRPVAAGTGD